MLLVVIVEIPGLGIDWIIALTCMSIALSPDSKTARQQDRKTAIATVGHCLH